jgi:hypothetical protein
MHVIDGGMVVVPVWWWYGTTTTRLGTVTTLLLKIWLRLGPSFGVAEFLSFRK